MASSDKLHFPDGASEDEQKAALRRLGLDRIIELRESVSRFGDTLPGRTAADSYQIVHSVYLEYARAVARSYRKAKEIRDLILMGLIVVGGGAAVWLYWPHLMALGSR